MTITIRVCFLQQINGLEENQRIINRQDLIEKNATDETEENKSKNLQSQQTIENKKKRQHKIRESAKKDYNDGMLQSAIEDLKKGMPLIDAATKHNIPRSTLYMRAKALDIHLNASRNGYPEECMNAAMSAVMS